MIKKVEDLVMNRKFTSPKKQGVKVKVWMIVTFTFRAK